MVAACGAANAASFRSTGNTRLADSRMFFSASSCGMRHYMSLAPLVADGKVMVGLNRRHAVTCDVVLLLEMPDGDAMTKLAVALTSRANVRTTTVRAYVPEEFGRLAAEAP